MGTDRVLVAFSNQTGSTAGIAEAIAAVLRRSGLAVDCRRAGDVTDIAPYGAVVLGSGVFVPRRASDGGGFLARHAGELGRRRVWLFCAGPIGRGRCDTHGAAGHDGECSVEAVARAIGARGTAVFGPAVTAATEDPMERLGPVDMSAVRAWALEIARSLAATDEGSGISAGQSPAATRCAPRRVTGPAAHAVIHR